MNEQTLAEARTWLHDNLEEGVTCPCCDQFAKIYRRRINTGMARALLALYKVSRKDPGGHYHLGRIAPWTHESAQLSWWGLIDQDEKRRDDGGLSGWWRITPLGEDFALKGQKLARYARIYNKQLLGFEDGKVSGIVEALGKKFNYRELMSWLWRDDEDG